MSNDSQDGRAYSETKAQPKALNRPKKETGRALNMLFGILCASGGPKTRNQKR